MPAYLPVSTVLSMWGDVLVSGASSSPALSCLSEALWLVLAHLLESAAAPPSVPRNFHTIFLHFLAGGGKKTFPLSRPF